jgi:hypothetical protein
MTLAGTAIAVSAALMTLATAAGAQTVSSPAAPTGGNTPTAAVSDFERSGMPAGGAFAPNTIPVADGVRLTPTVGFSFGQNDNVTLVPKGAAKSSSVLTLTPRVVAAAAYRAARYSVGYQGELLRYPASTRDNADNHELSASADNILDARWAVSSRLSYQDRKDPAGITDRPRSNELDHWHGLKGAVSARYGAPGAKGRLEVEVGALSKKYTNNRNVTQDADYTSTNLATRFGVRVMPKTTLLVEYRNTRFDYKRDVQGLDGTEQRYLVGADWEATALTSGSVKVGYLVKDYKSNRPGFKGLTWEGGFRWRPLGYSTFDVTTGRSASDPTGNRADYLRNSFVAANWTHEWASHFSTRVSLSHNESDFAGTNRQDKIDSIGLAANYDLRRWVRLGASYEYSKRNSTDNLFDYDRNLFSVFGVIAF